MTKAEDFDFDAGELSLDFANTAEMHASDNPEELLNHYDDLVTWGQAAGLIPTDKAKNLRRLAKENPTEASAVYQRAVQLREASYRIFSNLSWEAEVNPEDLDTLNQVLSEALTHIQVIPTPTGFDWEWEHESEALEQIIWPVARSIADLLTSENLDRVSECEDDRGCGYLFLDMSRNRSRRWCSMESCGNRAKAMRHYQRQRNSDRGEANRSRS
jgi:predicted RNA-binding Zn ribbon-like protein